MYNLKVYLIIYFTPGTEGAFYTVCWCALFLSLLLEAEIFILAAKLKALVHTPSFMTFFKTLGLLET